MSSQKRPDLGAYGQGGGRKATVPTVPTVDDGRDPVDPPASARSSTPAGGRASTSGRAPQGAAAAAAAAARDPEEGTVQMNVRISPEIRRRIDELKAAHPFGRRATVRDVLEDAINAAYAAQIGGDVT